LWRGLAADISPSSNHVVDIVEKRSDDQVFTIQASANVAGVPANFAFCQFALEFDGKNNSVCIVQCAEDAHAEIPGVGERAVKQTIAHDGGIREPSFDRIACDVQ
jgi:hypothetical protein